MLSKERRAERRDMLTALHRDAPVLHPVIARRFTRPYLGWAMLTSRCYEDTKHLEDSSGLQTLHKKGRTPKTTRAATAAKPAVELTVKRELCSLPAAKCTPCWRMIMNTGTTRMSQMHSINISSSDIIGTDRTLGLLRQHSTSLEVVHADVRAELCSLPAWTARRSAEKDLHTHAILV